MSDQITAFVPADIRPATHAGDKIVLSWVDEAEVPKQHRAYVQSHVRRLSKRHRLGRVSVRYFGPARTSSPLHEIDGRLKRGDFTYTAPGPGMIPGGVTPDDIPDTIALHHGIRGAELVAYIVAHELCHLLLRRDGGATGPAAEAACHSFATRYVLGRR